MNIHELEENRDLDKNIKLKEKYLQFKNLLIELRKRALPDELVASINKDIEDLNSISGSERELKKLVGYKQKEILKLLERELKLVPKNYYRNTWLGVGMAAIGIPLGVAFGLSLGNMAFLGIGLPIGLAIGVAIGTSMDQKAFEEGRQLDLEVNY